jgi:hypothetical protein
MSFTVRGPKGGVVVRRATLKRLRKTLPALVKRFGKVSVATAPAAQPTSRDVRARIVAYCRWGIANEPQIHYAQTRPIPLAQRKQLPLTTDCSGFATCAYADAGAPDPNGNAYSGSGYTGTLLAHGRHIARRDAKPGDLAVFGPGAGHHVVVLLEPGTVTDPLTCSHGQEAGPIAIRLSVEAAAQPSPITFLSSID